MTNYRITAHDAAGNALHLTEPDVAPSIDREMYVERATAHDALTYVARLMPAYSWSYHPDTDHYDFVPAAIAYYELVVPGASQANAERHVPTSGDHTFCTHTRDAKGRAACRRARKA